MMRLWIRSIAVICLLSAGPAASARESGLERFQSPHRYYEVTFQQLEHRRFARSDSKKINTVVYKITFYRTGADAPVRSLVFSDVYGWGETPKPATVASLFHTMVWSPKDDYVILPDAEASDGGTPCRTAVAVNPDLPWATKPVCLQFLVWVDKFRVIGNQQGECHVSVNGFDGRTGHDFAVRSAESPTGYEIVKADHLTVEMRKTLDNCRSEEAILGFVPEDVKVELVSLKGDDVLASPLPFRRANRGATAEMPKARRTVAN